MDRKKPNNGRANLRYFIFLAICCDLGILGKRLLSPAANIVTDFLGVPGCIGTAFSLLFFVVAAETSRRPGAGTLMGAVQSLIALSLGMTGRMGALSPIGYILPGIAVDLILAARNRLNRNGEGTEKRIGTLAFAMISNGIGNLIASLAANLIVFHLTGRLLLLYMAVSLSSGVFFGVLAGELTRRLTPVVGLGLRRESGY